MAFIIAGIFSGLILLYLKLTNNKFLKDISSFSKTNLITLALFLVLSYLFIMVAGNKGGTAAFQIINLNIIIAAIGGYLFYNEKLNLTKLIGIGVAIMGASIIIAG
jgi:drug/metabolite transporter (DMT)-like permease